MFEIAFMVLFSFMNIVGIVLWLWVAILTTEVLLCKDAKEINFKRIYNRKLYITLKKLRVSLSSSFYTASLLLWISSFIVLYYRSTEISLHVTSIYDYGRTITSILIPCSLIMLYRSAGFKISFLN